MNRPTMRKNDEPIELLITVTSVRLTEEYAVVKGYDKDEDIHTAFISHKTDRDTPTVGAKAIASYKYYEEGNNTRCWCE